MVVVLSTLLTSLPVRAHELQEDQGVSAVLHIPPDDSPVAGKATALKFEFSRRGDRFVVKNCDCSVSIETESGEPLRSDLSDQVGAPQQGTATVTFPKAGVYDIVVSGLSGQAGSTADSRFALTYRTRVTAGSSSTQDGSAKNTQVIILSATSLVLLYIVASAAIRRGGRYAQK